MFISLTASIVSAPQARFRTRDSPSISTPRINVWMFKVQFLPMEHLCRCRDIFCQYGFVGLTFCERYGCNGSQAQRWVINKGSTKVQLAGTNFCLDAGTSQWAICRPVFVICKLMFLFPQTLQMAHSSKYGNAMIISLRNSGTIQLITAFRSKSKVWLCLTCCNHR